MESEIGYSSSTFITNEFNCNETKRWPLPVAYRTGQNSMAMRNGLIVCCCQWRARTDRPTDPAATDDDDYVEWLLERASSTPICLYVVGMRWAK